MTTFATESTFREIAAALARGDVDGIVDCFAEDATLKDFSDPTVVHSGHAEIREVVAGYVDAFDDLSLEIVDLVASEDRLSAELLLRGTPKGETDPIEMHYCLFDTFRGDKVLSEHLYVDSRQLPAGN